jgi:hypothetical protein
MNAYPHLKNVHISPFENATSEYAIAQDFQNYLVEKFQSDGRLRISTIDPDSRIEGSVLDYREEIFSYTQYGEVSEYRVTILFSVTMSDLRMQKVMYENKNLMMSETYLANQDQTGDTPANRVILTSKDQAQEKIFEKVFDTIIRSTLEAW